MIFYYFPHLSLLYDLKLLLQFNFGLNFCLNVFESNWYFLYFVMSNMYLFP